MPGLSILLLGPPRIVSAQGEIRFDTRKATALLAYLAVTRQAHARDTLAALLWPDYSQANARAALRRTLSTVTRMVPEGHLATSRDSIGLKPTTDLMVDATEFQKSLREARSHAHPLTEICSDCAKSLAAALALYRDDFMAGFALRDSPEFDDWQMLEAESLRRDLAWALERLSNYFVGLGDFDAATVHARRWLALDRLHEPAHRMLMLLYVWSGKREAALQQYRECVQVLQRDLDVAPLEVTTELYAAIRESRTPPPPTAASPRSAAQPAEEVVAEGPSRRVVASELPLVGRVREWEALTQAYDVASSKGGGRLVVLQGEAGIGKSRLAEEFLRRVAAGGAVALTGLCYEGEANLAYGPVVEAMRSALQKPDARRRLEGLLPLWLGEASRLLPELQPVANVPLSPQPIDSPGAQSRFFEGLRQVLIALLSGPKPGVLFFDDLHWADGASLDYVSYLSRRLEDCPFCLLLAWREDRSAEGDRLGAIAAEVARRHESTLVELHRLGREEVDALLAPVKSPGLAERLYRETEGLPFFLVEYLNALSGDSDDGDATAMLGSVRALLDSRLRSVDDAGRQLLSAAAVIGRSFDFDTLREASGRSEEETLDALEGLLARGLVVEMAGGQPAGSSGPAYDFSHEKLRRLVYVETSLARRRLLHRRVADALVARARGARDAGALAGQIAYHYQMAGNEAASAEHYKQAGEYSSALYANTEAIAQFRAALGLGHPDVAVLHEAIGDLQTLTGEYTAAVASYETAAALCEKESLAGVEHKLGIVFGRRGSWEQSESHFAEALVAYGEAGPEGRRARVYADWGLTAYRQGDPEKARDLVANAFDLATRAGDVRARAQSHNMLGLLASNRGDLDEAVRHFEKSLSLDHETNGPAALNNMALAYAQAGDYDQALKLAEQALALSAARGDRHREAATHSSMADFLHASGRSAEAMAHLKQAVSIYAEIGVEAGDVQPAIWRLAEW